MAAKHSIVDSCASIFAQSIHLCQHYLRHHNCQNHHQQHHQHYLQHHLQHYLQHHHQLDHHDLMMLHLGTSQQEFLNHWKNPFRRFIIKTFDFLVLYLFYENIQPSTIDYSTETFNHLQLNISQTPLNHLQSDPSSKQDTNTSTQEKSRRSEKNLCPQRSVLEPRAAQLLSPQK